MRFAPACRRHVIAIAALALLSACSGSHRPIYSGHQESTEGVPGFVNGKKVSPHVKLGQSYSVDGEEFVPRNQPNYVEEGMASWYGPGFHGGKTANGEEFDTAALTAAHRTLPLPSIVKVTLLSTGKQAIVRVNDRGPFAHSRIIDLSRAAADKIGLLRAGTGKVRVEYMAKESQRFADLLAQGREPKSIDVASEVLNYVSSTQVAANTQHTKATIQPSAEKNQSLWSNLSPVSSAHAQEPASDAITATDLPAATADTASAKQVSTPEPVSLGSIGAASPFSALETSLDSTSTQAPESTVSAPPIKPENPPPIVASMVQGKNTYLQLGAFQNILNAERLRNQYANHKNIKIVKRADKNGQTLYHVRIGPYSNEAEGAKQQASLQQAGAQVKLIHE